LRVRRAKSVFRKVVTACAFAGEVVPVSVEFEVAVPRLMPALR
jgi:hypothetical protein